MPSALRLFSSALFQQIHLFLGRSITFLRARKVKGFRSCFLASFWATSDCKTSALSDRLLER